MDDKGKSRKISEALWSEIQSGKFDLGRKLPSERMLMRRFAVARATVQSAMRELFDEKLIERRPGSGTFLVDRAGLAAAKCFAVIVPDAYYSFYDRICRGIEIESRKHGRELLTVSLGSGSMAERARRAYDFAELCVRERVGGVFFQPFQLMKKDAQANEAILGVFNRAGIPVVLLDSDYLQVPMRSDYDLVGVDNTSLGYVLGRHMIERGAKRIWYFSAPHPAPTSLKRGTGVGMAVAEAGLRWTNDNVFFADPTDEKAAKRLFAGKNRPDAIIASNDYIASILLKTLNQIGKRVPDDVLLAGVNGDPVAEENSITTMVQPCREIGEAAVRLMMRRIEAGGGKSAPCEVFFSTKLEIRGSTGGNLKQRKRNRPK